MRFDAVISRMLLTTEDASVRIDPKAGGRVVSLRIRGCEVLVGPEPDPMRWGCYPMVPFAGRLRNGRFQFRGASVALPPNLGPHAIHGFGYTRAWEITGPAEIGFELEAPWPWAGRVSQRFALEPGCFALEMQLRADQTMPAMLGWHPWFRRDLARGGSLQLQLPRARMYERDGDGIPTGRLVDPPSGPWDDCFTELAKPPTLRWPRALELALSSTADHWVVYDEPAHALCVEPQTAAPDVFNRQAPIVEAGATLRVAFEIRWSI